METQGIDKTMPMLDRPSFATAMPETVAEPLPLLADLHKPGAVKDDSGFLNKIIFEPNHRNIFISSINALLHFIATITSFEQAKSGPLMKTVNQLSNNAAFFFTRWLAPLTSYGYAFYEALKNKKPIEALIKLVPPVFLPLVGEANIDTVYGSSTGFNQPYDMVVERITEKAKASLEFARQVDQANQTAMGNSKLVWRVFKEMAHEFVQGKMDPKKAIFFVNCIMILAGALPMMLFARDARDTLFARTLGLLRNAGGILGDIGLIWGERGNVHKLTIGILCMIGACADVVKRWVSPETAKVLIHLGSALNVSAYALWNAFNGKKHAEKKTSVLQAG